jgi:hypothetical protein
VEVTELKDEEDPLWLISKTWLEQFANDCGETLDFVLSAADYYLSFGKQYDSFSLIPLYDEQAEEFWGHYEMYMRKNVKPRDRRETPWECCP